jgi:hypothetical protein
MCRKIEPDHMLFGVNQLIILISVVGTSLMRLGFQPWLSGRPSNPVGKMNFILGKD